MGPPRLHLRCVFPAPQVPIDARTPRRAGPPRMLLPPVTSGANVRGVDWRATHGEPVCPSQAGRCAFGRWVTAPAHYRGCDRLLAGRGLAAGVAAVVFFWSLGRFCTFRRLVGQTQAATGRPWARESPAGPRRRCDAVRPRTGRPRRRAWRSWVLFLWLVVYSFLCGRGARWGATRVNGSGLHLVSIPIAAAARRCGAVRPRDDTGDASDPWGRRVLSAHANRPRALRVGHAPTRRAQRRPPRRAPVSGGARARGGAAAVSATPGAGQ